MKTVKILSVLGILTFAAAVVHAQSLPRIQNYSGPSKKVVVRRNCGSNSSCSPRVMNGRVRVVRRSNGTVVAGRRSPSIVNFNEGLLTRKEQLDKEIRTEDLGTKKYVLLVQERERLALDEIHKAQKYMLEHANTRNSEKYLKCQRVISEEVSFMQPTLDYMKDFPFAKDMQNMNSTLVAIRQGKIKFEKCAGKSYVRILTEIHDAQRQRLLEFQKNYLRQRF